MIAADPPDDNVIAHSTSDENLNLITYQSVSSVIKKCDKTLYITHDGETLNASSSSVR